MTRPMESQKRSGELPALGTLTISENLSRSLGQHLLKCTTEVTKDASGKDQFTPTTVRAAALAAKELIALLKIDLQLKRGRP